MLSSATAVDTSILALIAPYEESVFVVRTWLWALEVEVAVSLTWVLLHVTGPILVADMSSMCYWSNESVEPMIRLSEEE